MLCAHAGAPPTSSACRVLHTPTLQLTLACASLGGPHPHVMCTCGSTSNFIYMQYLSYTHTPTHSSMRFSWRASSSCFVHMREHLQLHLHAVSFTPTLPHTLACTSLGGPHPPTSSKCSIRHTPTLQLTLACASLGGPHLPQTQPCSRPHATQCAPAKYRQATYIEHAAV